MDFVQGIAVNCLGHADPKLVKTISDQSKLLWHVSNAFEIPEGEKLAKKVVQKKHLLTMLCFKILVQKPQKQLLKLLDDIFIHWENLKK